MQGKEWRSCFPFLHWSCAVASTLYLVVPVSYAMTVVNIDCIVCPFCSLSTYSATSIQLQDENRVVVASFVIPPPPNMSISVSLALPEDRELSRVVGPQDIVIEWSSNVVYPGARLLVDYTPNQRKRFGVVDIPLEEGVTPNTIDLHDFGVTSLQHIPGSRKGILLVSIINGVNRLRNNSFSFQMRSASPSVRIMRSPLSRSSPGDPYVMRCHSDEPLVLSAVARDAEDGFITEPSSVIWTVVDEETMERRIIGRSSMLNTAAGAVLGYDNSSGTEMVRCGQAMVTVTVTDSDNKTASDSITVSVEHCPIAVQGSIACDECKTSNCIS